MTNPDEIALIKRYMELLAWAILWIVAYAIVLVVLAAPLGLLRFPYLLAMTCVLAYDVARSQKKASS